MHVTELPGLLPLVGASWNGWISHQICAKNIFENVCFLMLAIVRNLLNNNLLENESPKVCYLTNF